MCTYLGMSAGICVFGFSNIHIFGHAYVYVYVSLVYICAYSKRVYICIFCYVYMYVCFMLVCNLLCCSVHFSVMYTCMCVI